MDDEKKFKRKIREQKRKLKALEEPAEPSPIVPVSVTHRVQAVEGSVRSAAEMAHQQTQGRLRELEDELLSESMAVVSGAVSFAEVPEDMAEPDGNFYEKYKDHPDPDKLFRIMKSAWRSAKEAPIGLAIAQRTAMGIVKARATEKAAPQPLALSVQVVTTMPEFKVLDVKG